MNFSSRMQGNNNQEFVDNYQEYGNDHHQSPEYYSSGDQFDSRYDINDNVHGRPNETVSNLNQSSSRGNLSYMEMISRAIESHPQQRLVLKDIYKWLIINMPYFTERQHKPICRSWQNTVRHNLSIYKCFIRIPNERPGEIGYSGYQNESQPGPTIYADQDSQYNSQFVCPSETGTANSTTQTIGNPNFQCEQSEQFDTQPPPPLYGNPDFQSNWNYYQNEQFTYPQQYETNNADPLQNTYQNDINAFDNNNSSENWNQTPNETVFYLQQSQFDTISNPTQFEYVSTNRIQADTMQRNAIQERDVVNNQSGDYIHRV
ncbi:hypothetical protein ACOME3_005503 [Neoechinorhynchus agilis]